MNKRGQFFILTAVIVSALIFSISLTVNQVTTQTSINKVDAYSNILDREIAQIENYQIYQKAMGNDVEEIESFVNKLSATLLDQDPNLNFVMIYGNDQDVIVYNNGVAGIKVGDTIVPGTSDTQSSITVQTGSLTTSSDIGGKTHIALPGENLTFSFDENLYYLKIPEENTVIFMLQKEEYGENFITIK